MKADTKGAHPPAGTTAAAVVQNAAPDFIQSPNTFQVAAAPSPAPVPAPAPASERASNEAPLRVSINGMTLLQAIGVALARNPEISRADAVIAQSASQVSIAKAAWYPTLQYGVNPGYGQNYGTGTTSSFGVQATAGVNQLIYDFGRTSSKVSAADATLNKSKYLLADTMETVAYDMATTFIDLAASQDMIGAANRQLAAVRETRSRIGERVAAGLSLASDQNLADVAIGRAEADLLTARTRFDVAAGSFAQLSGIRPQRVASLTETSGFVARLSNPVNDGRDTAPAILAANASLDAADASVRAAEAERFPSIGITASKTFGQQYTNTDGTFVGLSLGGSYSLGGLAGHQISAAKAERSAAAKTLENQRLVARTALDAAQTQATGAAARLTSYEKVIGLSRTSRELYWQEYTLNKRPLNEVITADRDIYSSEIERINAAADGVVAKIKANVAVGRFVQQLREQERN